MDSEQVSKSAPRFIFLTDQALARPSRQQSTGASHVAWRLLAANNRAMGRSARTFDSIEACFESAIELHRRIQLANYVTSYSHASSRWNWAVQLDADVFAVNAHLYQRRIECIRGVRQFLEAVAAAPPIVNHIRHIGARSFGVYRETSATAIDQ